jgi:hypothetical protein
MDVAPSDEHLSRLRRTLDVEEVDRSAVERLLGTEGLLSLRQAYFPRWRPGQVHSSSIGLRAYRRVLVEDPFEERLVRVIAPPELELRLQVDIARDGDPS